MQAQEVDIIDGFTFAWFTDGSLWEMARRNLREHSIDDMEKGIKKVIID